MTLKLYLTNTRRVALIDEEDWEHISQHTENWSVRRGVVGGEPKIIGVTGRSKILGKTVQLSQAALKHYGSEFIDHIDRNPLNNTKANLRIATYSQNFFNKEVQARKRGSKYKGVFTASGHRRDKPYIVEVRANKVRYYGGYFATEKEAALKANELMRKYHGEFAHLNVID